MIASKHPMRLCIHGHFYQPPRENPWTGRIETQPSAAPHHDWNERIAHQCYAPNGASRLLDPRGRIRGMLNNYRYMSFNFGPTLLDWLEEHFPETMARIVEADRLSREEQNGHGNALAQVYNHAIMPLGTRRDRRTQIAWGIRDFESRFGRRPEGMWLAETGINMDTVVDLIEQGIQFTVLSPTQAARVRPFDHEDWRSVENNEIDPTRPYRVFPLQENGEPLCAGHLDVFFYDGPVSTAVSFEHLLRDAKRFADRLSQAWNPESDRPQLVSIATDGESYGHHEPFGDMALAYLFETICPENGIIPTNFGHFLELHPPVEEVRLKNAHGEGTAWSCSHGTGRWIRDCGCNTGAPEGWNQAWRGPLREAMSLVRDAAEQAWDRLAPQLVIEPWKCRIDWMSVHRGMLPREEFQARHMLDATKERNRSRLALLLELVKMGQYCLTSCGWFFNDISGIEPVQNMRYAYRACDILATLGEPSPEEDVRRILERAKSNLNAWTGRSIWDMWVRPGTAFDRQLAGQILFERMLSGGEGPVTLHGIRLDPKLSAPRDGVRTGTVEITHIAFETKAILHVLGWRDPSGRMEARVLPAGAAPGPVDWSLAGEPLRKAVEQAWPARPIRLQDLLHDKRLELGKSVVAAAHQKLRPAIDALVRLGAPTVDELLELGLHVPDFLRVPEQVVLEELLLGFVEKTLAHPGAVAPEEVQALVQRARLLGVDDALRVPADRVAQALWNLFGKLEQSPSDPVCEAFVLLLELADGAGLALDKTDLENAGNRLRLRQLQPLLRQDAPSTSDLAKARIWVRALQRLNFDVDVEAEAMELAAFRKAEEK